MHKEQEEEDFSFLEPDESDLGREWISQPKAFHKYAVKLAEARKDHAESKARFELAEAELDSKIREDPSLFGVQGKVTEAVVKTTIIQQREYQAAQKEMIRAKYKVDSLEAVVSALEHRKKALENLVVLHSQNYFSEPRAPKGSKADVGEIERTATFKKAAKSLNK